MLITSLKSWSFKFCGHKTVKHISCGSEKHTHKFLLYETQSKEQLVIQWLTLKYQFITIMFVEYQFITIMFVKYQFITIMFVMIKTKIY